MKDTFLYTCGDSHSCIDSRYSKDSQWPMLVQNALGCDAVHLGRGASDNFYIYLQILKALEDSRTTHLVIWWTGVERFFIRDPNTETVPQESLRVENVKTHVNEHETNYKHDNYDPKYISDTYSNVIQTEEGDKQISRERYPNITSAHWHNLQQYWNYFYSFGKETEILNLMKYYVANECKNKNIVCIELPSRECEDKWRAVDDVDAMANHMNKLQHKIVSNHILKLIDDYLYK